MQKINQLRNEWKHLDEEGKNFFRYALLFIPFIALMMWLMSTNRYPMNDAPNIDHQTYYKKSYELKGSYVKYAQRVYNEKYNN